MMKDNLKKIQSIIESMSITLDVGIYLFENKKTKKDPFVIYKMLFESDIKKEILNLLSNEIDSYVNEIEEVNDNIPEYNPDEEQSIFKIEKSNLAIFQDFYPFITEEKDPKMLSKDNLNEKNKIKAWIIKIEFEEDENIRQILFLQKFVKSQFMQTKKMFFILDNDEFRLLKNDLLGMGNIFDVILLDDVFISKNLKTFEYIFDFTEYYKNKSKEFISLLESSELLEIEEGAKDKIKAKIERSKRFAYKLYSAQVNKYYEQIDIEKLKNLKEHTSIEIEIKNNKIIIDDNTNLDDLVKVLNDDYEQSIITNNKYIAQKKHKI